MRIVRMYTGADQCSHFEEIAAPLSIRLDAQRLLSPALPVKQSVFFQFAATFSMGWQHHRPPRLLMSTCRDA